MSRRNELLSECACSQQDDGQAVVCWHRNPNDVVADMMEDNSMAHQFQGRYTCDNVTDRFGQSHRVFASVSSSLWMQHWSVKQRGGNRVVVAVRVSGDEFIVTGKRGCHCVYLSAGNRRAQSREDSQSFYLLGVIPPYNRDLSVWAESSTHNKAACGRRQREIFGLSMFYMLENMDKVQNLRVAGTVHERQLVEAKVLMFSTDMKEQWDLAQTYGYGCVSCHAPKKAQADGVVYRPAAGRVMQDVCRDVLQAQQTGEYGTQGEWKSKLAGHARPFVKPDASRARLEVNFDVCVCPMCVLVRTRHADILNARDLTAVSVQIVAADRYSHCARVMGVFPDYNQLWDLDKIGVFNIYAMLPPDPMHVISGIQLHIICGMLRMYHRALCTEDLNPDKATWHTFNSHLDARVTAVGGSPNSVRMSSHVQHTFARIHQSAFSARGQATYAWRLKFHEIDELFQVLPFCLRDIMAEFLDDGDHDPTLSIIKCMDTFLTLVRDLRSPIQAPQQAHALQQRISEWMLMADQTFPSRAYVGPRDVGTARAVEAPPINHENTMKFHALHHVVLMIFAVGGWNVCSAAGMEAKHKEVRSAALRVNDRDQTQYDTGRQVLHLT